MECIIRASVWENRHVLVDLIFLIYFYKSKMHHTFFHHNCCGDNGKRIWNTYHKGKYTSWFSHHFFLLGSCLFRDFDEIGMGKWCEHNNNLISWYLVVTRTRFISSIYLPHKTSTKVRSAPFLYNTHSARYFFSPFTVHKLTHQCVNFVCVFSHQVSHFREVCLCFRNFFKSCSK